MLFISMILPLYNYIKITTVVVVIRFLILISYYLNSTKKFNITFMLLLMLNILGDLVFIQEAYYSVVISLGIYIVINLIFSLLVYNYYLKDSLNSFLTFITPSSILAILSGYILASYTGSVWYSYIVYGVSILLLLFNGVIYFRIRLNKLALMMLLGFISLSISATFSAFKEFTITNEYNMAFDTFFYGVALLLITTSVIYEDNTLTENT